MTNLIPLPEPDLLRRAAVRLASVPTEIDPSPIPTSRLMHELREMANRLEGTPTKHRYAIADRQLYEQERILLDRAMDLLGNQAMVPGLVTLQRDYYRSRGQILQ